MRHRSIRPRIRPLGPADFEAAALLVNRAFAPVARTYGLTRENCPGNGAFIGAEHLHVLHERRAALFGLQAGHALIGFAACKPGPKPAWYLEKLAIAPEHQTAGHGSALLTWVEGHCRKAGAGAVRIGIIDANTHLRAWYLGRGYVETGKKVFAALPFVVSYLEKALGAASL